MTVLAIKHSSNTKPNSGTPINWGHPLAEGLTSCYLLNERRGLIFYDSVGKNHMTGQSGGSYSVLKHQGWRSVATGAGGRVNASLAQQPAANFTVVYYGTNITTPGRAADLFMCSFTGTNTSPYVSWGLGYEDVLSSTKVRFYYNDGVSFQHVVGTSSRLGTTFLAIGSFSPGATKIFINGVQENSASNSTGTVYGSAPQVNFHNAPSYAASKNSQSIGYMCLLYTGRAFTGTDAKQMYSDPFSIVKRPKRVFVFIAGTAPTPSSLVRIERRQPRGWNRGIVRGSI